MKNIKKGVTNLSLLGERLNSVIGNFKKIVSGVEVVNSPAGVARFERGRTFFKGEIDGVPILVDVREGQFEITVRRPTGEKFDDGTEITERPVRVRGQRRWNDIPAKLIETTYF